MGSSTEFHGKLKVIEGTLTQKVYDEFTKEFGYLYNSRTRSKSGYKFDEIKPSTGFCSLVLEGSWKGCEMDKDIRPYLVFFANRGIFFKGRIVCRHEYGEIYAVDVNKKQISWLEGYIAFKSPVSNEALDIKEDTVYQ